MPDIDYKTRSRNGGNAQNQTGAWMATGKATGERYRYIEDKPQDGANGANADGANANNPVAAAKTRSRPNAEYVLYAQGEPVAVNADGAQSYFGTDILGSVRSVTDKYGAVKAQYEYDAFGTPYLSNIDSGMSFGYTGKIFDSATGLYDYGFRDYAPNSARFTTVDPVRDGSNWVSYVVNDPVNYIDPFGLTATDAGNGNSPKISLPNSTANTSPVFTVNMSGTNVGSSFDQKIIDNVILQNKLEKNSIHGHLLRASESYTTVNGENKENRGKDLLIIENPVRGESVLIPVSSIANMEGTAINDSLSENNFVLTYDPHSSSKYAPVVFTISSGSLFPEIPYSEGEILRNDGTTATNDVPWRGHNTLYWGSEGCITGQKGNVDGDWSDVIKKLNEWGVSDTFDIPMSFGLGTY